MLAVAAKELSEIQFPVLATPKLDGIRCLKINGKALSRSFKSIPNHHIRNWIEKHCPDGFDGEIICPKKTFNETQSLVMTEAGDPEFNFWVFDYVKDDLNKGYASRIEDLREWCAEPGDHTNLILLLPTTLLSFESLVYFERQAVADNYEGVMVRTSGSPYKCGRSTLREGYLLKIKRFSDAEAVVIGFEEKLTNTNELTRDELGHAKRSSHKENLVPAGTLGTLIVRDVETGLEFGIGTGFDAKTRQEVWDNPEKYLGKLASYQHQPSGMKEKPRFPSFRGFRDPRDL